MPEGTTYLDFETFMEVELRVGKSFQLKTTKMQINYSLLISTMVQKMAVRFVQV